VSKGATSIVRTIEIKSERVSSPVSCDVIRPSNWPTGAQQGPLIVALHGGSGGNGLAEVLAPLFLQAWDKGDLELCTVAVPHSGRSFWIDDVRGEQQWEQFVLNELAAVIGTHWTLDGRVALLGVSMGGLGVLRLAMKHPHRYAAAAALEPGIEAAMSWDEVDVRSTGVRTLSLFERLHGSPVDADHFARNHPPALVALQAEAISDSGLPLYLECGDDDALGLDEGAELMHRLFRTYGIRHEYHLVLGADHVGRSLDRRFQEAIAFIGRSLQPSVPDPVANDLRALLGKAVQEVRRGSATIGLHVRGNGPTVVLVPSLGRTACDFIHLADTLVAAGYRTVGVDPRGLNGRGLRDDLTLHDLAGDIVAAIEKVGAEEVHLVGHALGNRICRTVAADRPELVASLSLLAAGGMVQPEEGIRDALLRCFDLAASTSSRRSDIALAFFASANVPTEWMEGWFPLVAAAQGRAVATTPLAEWWEAAAPHTLVIQGRQDRVAVPENGRRYVADVGSRATLVEIEGAGHALLPEQGDRVAQELVAFLGRVTDQEVQKT
jgi:S-formylglutathione hydrolase